MFGMRNKREGCTIPLKLGLVTWVSNILNIGFSLRINLEI